MEKLKGKPVTELTLPLIQFNNGSSIKSWRRIIGWAKAEEEILQITKDKNINLNRFTLKSITEK